MKKLSLTLLVILFAVGGYAQVTVYSSSTGTDWPYNLAEGTTTSVMANPANDVLSSWQTLPFTWTFYGNQVTGYFVSDNGYITFDSTATTSLSVNDTLPSVNAPDNAILAFWDDMELIDTTAGTSDVIKSWTYGDNGNRVHVIQWHSITKLGGTNSDWIYIAILLYECGGFDIVHAWTEASGLTATVGTQLDSTTGTFLPGSPTLDFPSTTQFNTDDVVYHFYDNTFPTYDASLLFLDIWDYTDVSTAADVSGIIMNRGSATITSFKLWYQVDTNTAVSATVSANVSSGAIYSFNKTNLIAIATPGTYNVKVWVSDINGQTDEVSCNDDKTESLLVYGDLSHDRMILIEEATQWNCNPCASQNPAFNALLSANPANTASIKYHGWWPGADDDAMHLFNTTDNDARINYYSINGVPTAVMDGKYILGASYDGAPANLTQQMLDDQNRFPSLFDITINETTQGTNSVTIEATITPKADLASGNLVAHIVIIEELISYSTAPGTNFETDFPHPMRYMLPDNAGTPLTSIVNGVDIVISETYTVDPAFDVSELRAVVFIQDNSTLDVLQAAKTTSAPYFSGIEDLANANSDQIIIYPTNVRNNLKVDMVLTANAAVSVGIYNVIGEQVDLIASGDMKKGLYSYNVDVSNLTNGIYFVRFENGQSNVVKKFVKAN
ncbi:MAG: Omp28-related outer membrane protein [Bacteroidetes bacterium]|nr:Omp28-related outer membrane protein [Bacteroidota bacterium]